MVSVFRDIYIYISLKTDTTLKNLQKLLFTIENYTSPRTGHEGPDGEYSYSSSLSLTSTLDGGWVLNVTHRPLYR